MYETIVVGTDGSETAGVAVERAVELARASGGELHLVCAFRQPSTAVTSVHAGLGAPSAVYEADQRQADRAEEMVRRTASSLPDVKVHYYALAGDPADVLIEMAERHEADLIVVGSRGMSGAKRFLLGSVPNRVSHHAPCSVLIVKTC